MTTKQPNDMDVHKKKVSTVAGFAGVVAFLISAFFSMVAAVAFSSGAWIFFIIGVVLIGLTFNYSRKEVRSPSSAELTNHVASGMLGGMAFIGIFVVLYWLGFGESQPSKPTDNSTMAHIQCKEFVRERLKAPSSADFAFLDFSSSIVGENHYVIRSSVEAQNSFGVKLKNNYTCSVKWNGENENARSNWTLVSLNIDE